MLAARMYGKNDVRIEEIPIPVPKKGELLIKVAIAAVCGTDVRMISNGVEGIDELHPRILGHEIAGTIVKLGEGVVEYKVGQRVAIAPNIGCGICDSCVRGNGHLCPEYQALGINIDGGFAEYCIIPEKAVRGGNVCVLNDQVTFEEGAINEPLSCVCNGFEHANIQPGDNVLIIGAGPIGIMHCALALMAGAKVYLNDISKERLLEAQRLYPKINPIFSNLKDSFMNITNGYGADVIITACPIPEVQSQALELAALGGRIIFFGGIPANKEPVKIDTNIVHYKQLILSGTTRASLMQYRKTLKYITNGELEVKSMVTARYKLTDFDEAFNNAKSGFGLKNVIIFE